MSDRQLSDLTSAAVAVNRMNRDEFFRQFTDARPDAFLPNLATALNNQSLRLADLRRREEAEAVAEDARALRGRGEWPPVNSG